MAMRRFLYHDNLSVNLAKSLFYQPMVDSIVSIDPGYKGPSYNALRGKGISYKISIHRMLH